MTTSKHLEPATEVINSPALQQPKNLLQRPWSGITHTLPFRISTPKGDSATYATAIPNAAKKCFEKRIVVANSEQVITPQLEVNTTGGNGQSHLYDFDSSHSYVSIEKRRCSFCGMRGLKIVQNQSCHVCRSGDAGSHITCGCKAMDANEKHSTVDTHQFTHLADYPSSVSLGSRPVTPECAARKISSPPRISRLPPGVIRLPAASALQANQDRNEAVRSLSEPETASLSDRRHGMYSQSFSSSKREDATKKLASPKLHHTRGLSNSENFPYVHKHEISKHAAAFRAESTSPLADQRNSPKSPSSAVVYLQASPIDVALDSSGVYRKRSSQRTQLAKPLQSSFDVTDSGATFGSKDIGSTRIGDVRLELQGGSGQESPCPNDFDTDSDANLPPACVVPPQRVATMRQKMNGKAPVSSHFSRIHSNLPIQHPGQDTETFPSATTFTTTIEGPPERSSSFHISTLNLSSFFHQQPKSPTIRRLPIISESLTLPSPRLRGGAASPGDIPPTLFWLAGGRGKSGSFDCWKKSRPRRRMGGLFGMAVFGKNYGREYGHGASQKGEVEGSSSASIKVAPEKTVSITSTRESTSRSSVSSMDEPAQESTASTDNAAPTEDDKPKQGEPTPPPAAPADPIPLCSGALPVEPASDAPANTSSQAPSVHTSAEKVEDAAANA